MGQKGDPDIEGQDTMTWELDDGTSLECIVLQVFLVDDREYIALLPMNDKGGVDEDAQIYLYRLTRPDVDEIILNNIEDDDEFEMASDYFDEMLDEEEFDSLFDHN